MHLSQRDVKLLSENSKKQGYKQTKICIYIYKCTHTMDKYICISIKKRINVLYSAILSSLTVCKPIKVWHAQDHTSKGERSACRNGSVYLLVTVLGIMSSFGMASGPPTEHGQRSLGFCSTCESILSGIFIIYC